MRARVLELWRREGLTAPGTQVVCAVSGGADSVALLHCLLSLQDTLQIRLSAAHFNHGLRGAESDGDEAFVRRICDQWHIPLAVGRGDAAARAAETGESIEEAARNLRYAFLHSLPGMVALAHNADDQVETVLLNLVRGTGLMGLCAMPIRHQRLLRPLLTVSRREIEAYLQAHDLPHREDSSNQTDDARRNRLRHHVIPLLKEENPALTQTVGRMTALLQQEEAYLQAQTRQLLEQAARPGGHNCQILRESPEVLRRRVIRALLPGPDPAMAQVDAVEALLADSRGSAWVPLPGGFRAVREYDLLRIQRSDLPQTFSPAILQPGLTVLLEEADLVLTMEGPIILEKKVDSLSTFSLKYDMMEPIPAITVRPRQTGDVLRLPGGRKTVKQLMIDRKLPAAQRDLTPVLADNIGIFAVFGLGADPTRSAAVGERSWIIQIKQRRELL